MQHPGDSVHAHQGRLLGTKYYNHTRLRIEIDNVQLIIATPLIVKRRGAAPKIGRERGYSPFY
jgi:hypothetical protein